MNIKMNTNLINKTVDDVISIVLFLCSNNLSNFEISSNLDVLNEKMNTLQTLVLYSDDNDFVKNVCLMQIITDKFNDEIMKELGTTFSKNFRKNQLLFLKNISNTFNLNLKIEEMEITI